MVIKKNRQLGLAIITSVYIAAAIIALYVSSQLANNDLISRIFWADLAATVFVYLVGVILSNATVYDPYWSVAPIVIAAGLIYSLEVSGAGVWLLFAVVCIWGVRLTANWVYTFRDLDHQDWRYDLFKERFPRAYPLISFGGIHLFPTLVVFFAMIPAIKFIERPSFNFYTAAAGLICLAAAVLQGVADMQMHRFRLQRENPAQIIETGLWSCCRHPNYLAEIIFWWGIYLFIVSVDPGLWRLGFGALINTMMFVFISIPMAERRLASQKPGYVEYAARTRLLIPLK
ncbi:MAG: DUF1295 domain-containing protein, partial [Clostridiaceae bacterium]|nr:DUF1295 domain-containing protein [Clostridiaceae bacterium]